MMLLKPRSRGESDVRKDETRREKKVDNSAICRPRSQVFLLIALTRELKDYFRRSLNPARFILSEPLPLLKLRVRK
jgi:hypothetical protein